MLKLVGKLPVFLALAEKKTVKLFYKYCKYNTLNIEVRLRYPLQSIKYNYYI